MTPPGVVCFTPPRDPRRRDAVKSALPSRPRTPNLQSPGLQHFQQALGCLPRSPTLSPFDWWSSFVNYSRPASPITQDLSLVAKIESRITQLALTVGDLSQVDIFHNEREFIGSCPDLLRGPTTYFDHYEDQARYDMIIREAKDEFNCIACALDFVVFESGSSGRRSFGNATDHFLTIAARDIIETCISRGSPPEKSELLQFCSKLAREFHNIGKFSLASSLYLYSIHLSRLIGERYPYPVTENTLDLCMCLSQWDQHEAAKIVMKCATLEKYHGINGYTTCLPCPSLFEDM